MNEVHSILKEPAMPQALLGMGTGLVSKMGMISFFREFRVEWGRQKLTSQT